MTDVEVSNNAASSRYEARVGGEVAGYAEYELDEGEIVFTHTVVEDQYEGQGVGSALAKRALDDVRSEGSRRVVPQCRFIKGWIEKHPDYADLVHPAP